MIGRLLTAAGVAALVLALGATSADALSRERWTDGTPYGIFFNDYDPNFYTGFAPRVQERDRIKFHLARGNQLRVRMILPDASIDNYVLDLVARRDLHNEVIDKGIFTLAANTAWEEFEKRFADEKIRELAAKALGR